MHSREGCTAKWGRHAYNKGSTGVGHHAIPEPPILAQPLKRDQRAKKTTYFPNTLVRKIADTHSLESYTTKGSYEAQTISGSTEKRDPYSTKLAKKGEHPTSASLRETKEHIP